MDLREYQLSKTNKADLHPWETARLGVIRSLIKKSIKKLSPKELVIMDIGCGDLFVIKNLHKKFNFKKVLAVDTALTDEEVQALNSNFIDNKITIFNGLEKCKNEDLKVSVVLLMDVIEHVGDDRFFLNEIINLPIIDENTLFLITVPSFNYLYCSHDKFLEHYRRYSNNEIKELAESEGLKIINRGYFFSILLIPRYYRVLKEKLTKRPKANGQFGTDLTNWKSNKIFSYILKLVLISDYHLSSFLRMLGIRLPGLSNFIICRKSVL